MIKKKKMNTASGSSHPLVKTSQSSSTDSEFAASIYDAYQAFDPSTGLDESGHGTNGAPHNMLDVITDMNYCKDEIYRLYQAVTHR